VDYQSSLIFLRNAKYVVKNGA